MVEQPILLFLDGESFFCLCGCNAFRQSEEHTRSGAAFLAWVCVYCGAIPPKRVLVANSL